MKGQTYSCSNHCYLKTGPMNEYLNSFAIVNETFKVAGAGYYNKILFITKHRNVCDVSVRFIEVR